MGYRLPRLGHTDRNRAPGNQNGALGAPRLGHTDRNGAPGLQNGALGAPRGPPGPAFGWISEILGDAISVSNGAGTLFGKTNKCLKRGRHPKPLPVLEMCAFRKVHHTFYSRLYFPIPENQSWHAPHHQTNTFLNSTLLRSSFLVRILTRFRLQFTLPPEESTQPTSAKSNPAVLTNQLDKIYSALLFRVGWASSPPGRVTL